MPYMLMNNTYIAIMAGGVGARFWPGSREDNPKQFLDILGVGKSLIQLTFERFLKLVPADHIFVVTHKKYKEKVLEHLPALEDNQVLCEPSRNNTAPSVAYTAFKLRNLDSDANFVIAPSDHVILKEEAFLDKIKEALAFSTKNDALLTLGIQPTRPDTGYGYINFLEDDSDVKKVISFKEKPDIETAQSYLDSGDYLWNAGIFIWKASSILSSFQKNAPEIFEVLSQGESFYNTAKEQAFIDEYYPKTTKISVDFAIMEKADNIYTLPADIGWSDLGTWASLHAELADEKQQNNVVNTANIRLYDTSNCLIRLPKNKLAIIKGLQDYIVVDEGDVLLIYPKSQEQEIKQIRQSLEDDHLERYL